VKEVSEVVLIQTLFTDMGILRKYPKCLRNWILHLCMLISIRQVHQKRIALVRHDRR